MFTMNKTNFLFFTFTMFLCFNLFFLMNTDAQDNSELANANYTIESIEVPGVDFLALTASNDLEHYAGYTKSADGEKDVAFTLIDGVFTTYSFPDSLNTYFFALDNNGQAAGHYEDSAGLFHGIILEDGKLRKYNFSDAVQTFIYGISDTTGALTGSFIDAAGVRRGFSGDTIVEVPGAVATYADFVSATGAVIGSYVDSDGIYHGYVRAPDGRYIFADVLDVSNLEYFFAHAVNDVGVAVIRAKAVGDIWRTYLGNFGQIRELRFPGSISTEGWNINRDGSVVGHYMSTEGRTHGFIARPVTETDTPVDDQPIEVPAGGNYAFQTIDVPGVDFLQLTASSDFEDYAGNTWGSDGEKIVGFTLIEGVFTTYDFPGSQNTYFYALGNNGNAAGHYEDSDGLFHGVVLENGELRQYDFPGAVQTQIYGISDATGSLTGNFIDNSGVRRGFSGDTIIEYPGAVATYADFVSASGTVVGSFIDSDGMYHAYGRAPDGRFGLADFSIESDLDYLFTHGINDLGFIVVRAKAVGDIPRTYVGRFGQLQELQFPDSVSTEGYNINQDGSVVGHYRSADGRILGFTARPTTSGVSYTFDNTFHVTLMQGLNMLSVPLASPKPMTAKSLAEITGATVVIALDADNQRFIGWTPSAPNDGFPIEGGQGYIVNVTENRSFDFIGAPWTKDVHAGAAPTATQNITPRETWAFVVSGHLEGTQRYEGYHITVRNLRTDTIMTARVSDNYFAAATADLTRKRVVQVGDTLELTVSDTDGNVASEKHIFTVTPDSLTNAVLPVKLDSINQPNKDKLLQNYPNPFNPETWIPYQLSVGTSVSISIYDATGKIVRTLPIGYQSEGFYHNRGRAAYWDGRNKLGERVASGVYFYRLETPSFQQTLRMIILK